MSELTNNELVELQKASDTSSITGISAITARLLNHIADTLDGTKPAKPFAIIVSVDKSSIDNIADVVTKTLQPQITAVTTNVQTLTGQTNGNITDIAVAKANLETLTGQTGANTTELATAQTNIQNLRVDSQANKDGLVAVKQELTDRLHHTQEQLRRLEETVEKRWPEIRAELVRLIETERREQRHTIAEIQATILRNQAHSAAPDAATSHPESPRQPRGSGHR
jgi:ABC-type transporter Mla subunit MlaD